MVEAAEVAAAVAAIRAGQPVLLPADGVYGLCASAFREAPVRRLYELKGRDDAQPTAMIASSVDMLLECVPELRGRSEAIVRALLPGPYTLVLPNPAHRYPWLNGERLETIGVRVAELPRARSTCSTPSGLSPPRARTTRASRRPRASTTSRSASASAGRGGRRGRSAGEPSTVLDLTGDRAAGSRGRGRRRRRRGEALAGSVVA